jgi:hypothetical protein
MVWRPRDNVKSTRSHPCGDPCMHIGRVAGVKIVPDEDPIIIGPHYAVDLDAITNILQKSRNVLADVPILQTHYIHHHGCLMLPYTCRGSLGSPGLMAKRMIIFCPWP